MHPLIIFAVSCFATAILFLILVGIVLLKSRKGEVHNSFILFYIGAAVWSGGLGLEVISHDKTAALFWARFLHAGVIFLAPGYLHFILSFVKKAQEKRRLLTIIYCSAFFLFLSDFTGLLVKDVSPKFYFNYYSNPGIFYPLLLVFFSVCVIYAFVELMHDYEKASLVRKNRLKYFFFSLGIGYIAGSATYLPVFNMPVPFFCMFIVFIHPVVLAYAILKHRLMDIHVVIRWSTVVSILAVVLTSLYVTGVVFATKYLNMDIIAIRLLVIVFILVTVLFFHCSIKYMIESVVLMREKDEKEELNELYQNLATTLDLKEIKWVVISELEAIFRTRCVTLVLFDLKERRFKVYASVGYEEIEKVYVAKDSPLVTWLMNNNRPAVYDWLDAEREEDKKVQDVMDELNMTVAMVLAHNDTMVGMLGLAEKKRRRYTADEIVLFAEFCEKMAVPFTNAVKHRLGVGQDDEDEQGEKLPSIPVPPNLNEPGKPKIFFHGVEVKDDPKDPYSVYVGPLHAVNRKWDWIKMRDRYDPTIKEIRLAEEEKKDEKDNGDDPA